MIVLLQRHTCMGADEGEIEQRQTLVTLQPTECDTIPYKVLLESAIDDIRINHSKY